MSGRVASIGLAVALLAQPARGATTRLEDSPNVPFLAKLVARGFFSALLAGDLDAALPLCASRVDFDGASVAGKDAIRERLRQMALRARSRQLRLHRLVVLSRAEMWQRFGPAPARLRGSIRAGQFFALASFKGRGAIAVLGRTGRFYRVVALTD